MAMDLFELEGWSLMSKVIRIGGQLDGGLQRPRLNGACVAMGGSEPGTLGTRAFMEVQGYQRTFLLAHEYTPIINS